MKPLFIPLNTEPYEQFEAGTKDYELRLYGNRWNEHTCKSGRAVTLSKGYGKQSRLKGVISKLLMSYGTELTCDQQTAALKHFKTLNALFAVIYIEKVTKLIKVGRYETGHGGWLVIRDVQIPGYSNYDGGATGVSITWGNSDAFIIARDEQHFWSQWPYRIFKDCFIPESKNPTNDVL